LTSTWFTENSASRILSLSRSARSRARPGCVWRASQKRYEDFVATGQISFRLRDGAKRLGVLSGGSRRWSGPSSPRDRPRLVVATAVERGPLSRELSQPQRWPPSLAWHGHRCGIEPCSPAQTLVYRVKRERKFGAGAEDCVSSGAIRLGFASRITPSRRERSRTGADWRTPRMGRCWARTRCDRAAAVVTTSTPRGRRDRERTRNRCRCARRG
jgi:hypothetical protein